MMGCDFEINFYYLVTNPLTKLVKRQRSNTYSGSHKMLPTLVTYG